MRKWFLASHEQEQEVHICFADGDVAVVEGQPVPEGTALAHHGRLSKGTWAVRANLVDDGFQASFASLLDGMLALDRGFEPKDSHEFEGRPGLVATLDLLVMLASKGK